MKNSTIQLFELMQGDIKVYNYIYTVWNTLFNKIYNHKVDWEDLDDMSGFALQDMAIEGII